MSFPGGRQLYFGNMVINSQWIWKWEALHIISVQWEEGENVRTVHTSAVSGQDHFPNPFEGHDVLRMCNRTIWWKWSDSKIFEEMAEKIYIVGCMEMLQTWMVDYVEPLIDGYYGLGTVIAILEIISIALVSAYAAQINRRRRREALFGMQSKFPGARGQKISLMPTQEDESEV